MSRTLLYAPPGLVAIVVLVLLRVTNGDVFNLGVLLPYTGHQQMRTAAGAIQLAIDSANTDKTLTELRRGGHRLSFTWRDTACDTKQGLLAAVDLWANRNDDDRPIDAFIGAWQTGCYCVVSSSLQDYTAIERYSTILLFVTSL